MQKATSINVCKKYITFSALALFITLPASAAYQPAATAGLYNKTFTVSSGTPQKPCPAGKKLRAGECVSRKLILKKLNPCPRGHVPNGSGTRGCHPIIPSLSSLERSVQ